MVLNVIAGHKRVYARLPHAMHGNLRQPASTASCTGEVWMTLDIAAGALCRLLEMIDQPREQTAPIRRSERRFDVVLRVRHHAEHVAPLVEHAGDGVGRAIDVPCRLERPIWRRIAEQHPPLALEPRDG